MMCHIVDYEYVVVDVISITNGRLLLLEKRGEFWILPGGKREKGESDLECIVRELSQEQPKGKLIGETTFFYEFYGLSPSGKKIMVLCYFGRVEGDTSPGAEITDARRVSGDELLSYPLSAIMRLIAKKLLDEKYLVLERRTGEVSMKSEKKIGFIPTAGARTEVFRNGRRLPIVFTWAILKWLYKMFEIETQYLESLKEETIKRLEKALKLYLAGTVDCLFLSGGQSTQSVHMMSDWLVSRGVKTSAIITDSESLQTSDKTLALVDFLKEKDVEEIHVITSAYHVVRIWLELKRALGENEISIILHPATIPITREGLMREALYNILAEPFKLFLSVFFSRLKSWYRKKESNARGL